jgi:hypothetical protein
MAKKVTTLDKYIVTAKSKSVIRNGLRELRKFIDKDGDALEVRIAYAMECAILWVLEDTKDWGTLVDEAIDEARIYRDVDSKRIK